MNARLAHEVVIIDGGYASYEVEERLLGALNAEVILNPCEGDISSVKDATAEADAVLVRESPVDADTIKAMKRCRVI